VDSLVYAPWFLINIANVILPRSYCASNFIKLYRRTQYCCRGNTVEHDENMATGTAQRYTHHREHHEDSSDGNMLVRDTVTDLREYG